jgi:hypothetical protein
LIWRDTYASPLPAPSFALKDRGRLGIVQNMTKLTYEQVREKYYRMIQTQGVDHAISAVHREIGKLEPAVFDGGYDQERFRFVQQMRILARDLYTYKLEQDSKKYKTN